MRCNAASRGIATIGRAPCKAWVSQKRHRSYQADSQVWPAPLDDTGSGRYLRDAVTRACRRAADGQVSQKAISAAAQQFLDAGDAVGLGVRVFILNQLAHAGSHRDPVFWHKAAEAGQCLR